MFVLRIETDGRGVNSPFVQDVEAMCQQLIEDSSDVLFPDSLCSQLVRRRNPNKDRETSVFFITSSGPATEFEMYQY